MEIDKNNPNTLVIRGPEISPHDFAKDEDYSDLAVWEEMPSRYIWLIKISLEYNQNQPLRLDSYSPIYTNV